MFHDSFCLVPCASDVEDWKGTVQCWSKHVARARRLRDICARIFRPGLSVDDGLEESMTGVPSLGCGLV